MRLGELITAVVLALFSIFLMWESAKLPIGYEAGKGPGGGFWPFWLSAMMLISTGFIAWNWYKRTSPPSQSEEPVLDRHGWKMFLQVGGGLLGFIILIDILSMYGAMAVFLLYYVRFLGGHSWLLTLILVVCLPIGFFFFFEGLMRITMPSGMSFTAPFYDVMYDIIY